MPLPPSAIPAYQPRSFVTPGSERITNKATELFFRYHPAVFKTKTFELLMKDEQYRSAADTEKRKLLSEELLQLNGLLSRYRESGVGPSGSVSASSKRGGASGRGGGGLRGGSDSLGFISDMSRNENDRYKMSIEGGRDALREYDKLIEIPRPLAQFSAEFFGKADLDKNISRMSAADLETDVTLAFLAGQERFQASVQNEDALTRQVAATDFYYQLRQRRPDLLPAAGDKQINPEAAAVMSAIDRMYMTDGFLMKSFQSGREPDVKLTEEKARVQATLLGQTSPGAGVFESRAREILGALPASAVDTPEKQAAAEKKAMEQARSELGIGEPLSNEEALMLSRYTEALSDDGVATKPELGDDYDAALAAYNKGRRSPGLPRGAEAYYDNTYLDTLRRRGEVERQLGMPGPSGTSVQRAAARMVGPSGLPDVTPEALAAAAAVSPLAAEALPYAMARFMNAGGVIRPQSEVERKAQRLLDADPNRRPGFNEFVSQVNKMYPEDTEKRREAFAYYAAYLNAGDLRMQTTDEARLAGKPPPPPPAPVEPRPELRLEPGIPGPPPPPPAPVEPRPELRPEPGIPGPPPPPEPEAVDPRIQRELSEDDLTSYPDTFYQGYEDDLTSYPETFYQGYDVAEPASEDLFLQELRMDDEVPPMQDFSTPDAQIDARVQQDLNDTPPLMTDLELDAAILQKLMKPGPYITDDQYRIEQFYRDALRRRD